MKTFLAVYMGSMSGHSMDKWNGLSPEERDKKAAAGMDAWGKWMMDHANVVKDGGGPLGKTKKISPEGITDVKNLLTGYTLLQAETHEEAAKMFLNHPHFSIFPGDSVEVMEVLPIPKKH